MRRLPLILAFPVLGNLFVGAGLAAADTTGDRAVMLSQRPGPAGVPTPVEVGLFVVDVPSIDDVKQEFTADLYVTATWEDSRLEGEATRTLPLADVWHPLLTILNRRDLDKLFADVVHVEPDGKVTYGQRLVGHLSARMNLREFPRDHQTLSVSIVAVGSSPDEIDLRPTSGAVEGFQDFSVSNWKLTLQKAEASPIVIPSTGRRLPHVAFEIGAERRAGYYLWVMYVPLLFIVLMAWLVFWIDPSLVASQIAVSTAAVFSLIAFRFSMRLALPSVPYMTRMDKFVLGCTTLVFLALGQAVVTGRLAKQGREVLARRMDRWGRWIYLAAFILVDVVYLL